FAAGPGVDRSKPAPSFAAASAGGSRGAGSIPTGGRGGEAMLLDNGLETRVGANYWCLPFKPQTNHVYLLTVVMGFTNDSGRGPEFGFSINVATNNYAGTFDPRFNGTANGYDWMAVTYGGGNVQFFAGNKAANALLSANGVIPGTPSTNRFQIILDSRGGTNW